MLNSEIYKEFLEGLLGYPTFACRYKSCTVVGENLPRDSILCTSHFEDNERTPGNYRSAHSQHHKPDSVVKEYLITAADGKQYRTKFYNFDMILAISSGVRSHRDTQFRVWATKRLCEHLVKDFVLDDIRLKEGRSIGADYFDELKRGRMISLRILFHPMLCRGGTSFRLRCTRNQNGTREASERIPAKMKIASIPSQTGTTPNMRGGIVMPRLTTVLNAPIATP